MQDNKFPKAARLTSPLSKEEERNLRADMMANGIRLEIVGYEVPPETSPVRPVLRLVKA